MWRKKTFLQRKPLYEQVVENLVLRIKDGTYKLGSRLPSEHEFAEEFQVGRNCIREAIKCLSAGGLVISKSGKGSFLTPHAREIITERNMVVDFSSYNSLIEILELRLIIEPEAAAMAAERASPKQITELDKIFVILKKQMDEKRIWEKTGLKFHNLVVKMTGNILLMKVMKSISAELSSSRKYMYKKIVERDQRWHEHREIYQSIYDRDSERAKNLMRRHLEKARELYL
jgi:GntR family transcriptional repressor for pyruvate dehydrogenase complex